jgi:hypothetical protein
MAWRSLRLVPVVAAIALVALLAAGCGGDDDSSSDAPPSSLLATAASKQIDSADVRLRVAGDIPGFPILGDRLSFAATGPVAMGSSGYPELDWDAVLRAGGQAFPTHVTALDGDVYLDFQGLSYQVDPDMLALLPLGQERKQKAMSLKSLGIDPSDWLTNTKVEDGAEIGGDSTRVVTGTVDEQAVLDDVAGLADSPEVQDQLDKADGSGDLPELDGENLERVADAITAVDVEVNVDDEGYPRRVFASLRFKMPENVKDAAFEKGTVSFELVFEQIGDVSVNVAPPADPRPLSDLFNFAGAIFGVDELSDLWTIPQ